MWADAQRHKERRLPRQVIRTQVSKQFKMSNNFLISNHVSFLYTRPRIIPKWHVARVHLGLINKICARTHASFSFISTRPQIYSEPMSRVLPLGFGNDCQSGSPWLRPTAKTRKIDGGPRGPLLHWSKQSSGIHPICHNNIHTHTHTEKETERERKLDVCDRKHKKTSNNQINILSDIHTQDTVGHSWIWMVTNSCMNTQRV